jgi:hypothetical protein
MFYTVYKTTNMLNGKSYIGKHQTKDLDDGYMGSGKFLKRAIMKYGRENFIKEILHIFDNEDEMNAKEKELVVLSEMSYNLCEGGHGGFGFINKNRLFQTENHRKAAAKNIKLGTEKFLTLLQNPEWKQEWKNSIKNNHASLHEDYINPFFGKHHTEEYKKTQSKIMKGKQSGPRNSQHGTMWITDGISNRKVKKDLDAIPDGWYKGRITK